MKPIVNNIFPNQLSLTSDLLNWSMIDGIFFISQIMISNQFIYR